MSSSQDSAGTGRLGMRLLIASLSMLFAASVMGFAVVRSRAAVWPPPGVPDLPPGLWLSTVLLLTSSATIWVALDGVRKGRERALRVGLLLTLVLGIVFLISQSANWFVLVAARLTMKTNLYGFLFYLLTGLHALHVLGGLVPLATTTHRAYQGRYTSASHAGVEYISLYWHFLDVIWVILFFILLVGG